MAEEHYYYDYAHYYDAIQFNVTSTKPGWQVLLWTTVYTVVCITIGFLFVCRKRKWRKEKRSDSTTTGKEGATNEPQSWVDRNPYICAVDEVVENALFDNDLYNASGTGSIESDNSSEAYEFWEKMMFGAEESGAETSYELYKEDLDKDNNKIHDVGKAASSNEKSVEIRSQYESPIDPKPESEPSIVSIPRDSEYLDDSFDNFSDDSPPRSPPPRAKSSADHDRKKAGTRRFLSFGRKNRRFSVKKREKKNRGFKAVQAEDKMEKRSRTLNRLFHKQHSLEIELRESKCHASKQVDESYENFDDYEHPSEVDKCFDPDLNCSGDTIRSANSSFSKVIDRSGEGDDTFEKEMQEIKKLAIPWTFSSFISYFASIVAIALISSFMSVAAMIAYSYVWFIIDAAFMYPCALYNSLYKHVNNAIAQETDEGYTKAGKYMKFCMIINFIISIPLSIAVYFAMGPIMRFYGFGEGMVDMCQGYTIISLVHNLFSYTSSFITITTDIDGYADFNAKYSFFDTLVDIALSAFVIPLCSPTLIQLGLIHLAHDVLSTALYYYLTWYKWGWYDPYKPGLKASMSYDRKDRKALATLIKKSIPMTLDELNGELEWLVSAYFASFLGNAESASWILLSYIWGLIGVVPSCVGSAVEYRVAYQLSKGNIDLSKQISNRCMLLTGVTSFLGTASMFVFRHQIIHFITNDFYLSQMLTDVVPYLLLCQPLISLTTTGAHLNRALAMYQRSTKIELLITCLVTIPAAYVSTFIYNWDISGLTAASFIGYATMGTVILALYNNADWEKAVRKNKKMAGTVDSSKLDISIETTATHEDEESDGDTGVLV